MARAQWSPRVWEPMTKEGHASLLPRNCWEVPWYDTALPCQLLWGRGGTLWHALMVTPEKCLCGVVSLQPAQIFCCSEGSCLASGCDAQSAGERGQDREVLRDRLTFCLDWPSAWMDRGLGSQLTVLLGDVSRAIDKGVVGVAHLGFKRYISLYSSDSYPAILIIDQSTILKTPKHLPPEKSLCSPQRHWELFW